MSTTPLLVNQVTYNYPETGAQKWGPDATNWAIAVTVGMLQKTGGLFQLLSDVDFGTTFGLKATYYQSRATHIASAGVLRLGNTDIVGWRNHTNDGDVTLTVDSSDNIVLNANLVPDGAFNCDLGSAGKGFLNLFIDGDAAFGSNATISGNLTVGGTFSSGAYTVTDLTATGNTILGDNSSDTLTVTASLASSLIPNTDATYTLGSSGHSFSDCYFGDINTKKVVPITDATYELGSSSKKFSNGYFSNTVTMDSLVTTTVGSVLTPLTTATYDLGVTGTRWRNLFLSGNATVTGNVAATGTLGGSNFSGSSSGANTGDQTITLTSEATGSGTGSFAVTLANSAVISKVLTGYTSGAGTVSATDTILQAIQKLNGNTAAITAVSSLTGEATGTGPGATAVTLTNSAVIGKVLTGYTSGAGTVSATDTILQAIQKLNGNAAVISGAAVTSLTGEATGSGPGATAITLTNSAVIGKVLTGYSSGAGTVSATDTILQSIQKLNGNDALALPLTGGTLTGTLTSRAITPSANATYDIGVTGTRYVNLWLSGNATVGGNVAATGTLAGSNYSGTSSGTNTGDQTITLTGDVTGSGTGSFATAMASSISGNKVFSGSVQTGSSLVGTGTLLGSELLTVLNAVSADTATQGINAQTTKTLSSASSTSNTAIVASATRAIATSNSNDAAGQLVGLQAGVAFTVPAAQTLTRSATTSALLLPAITAPTGTLAVTTVSKIRIAADSVNTGTNKIGILALAQTGASNNAALADGTSFSGTFFINQSATDPSSFGGSVTAASLIPSGSTVPANGLYLPAANTPAIASNTVLATKWDANGNVITSAGLASPNYQTITPVTGDTITCSPNLPGIFITPAGTLSSLTIKLPSSPIDGQQYWVVSSQLVTTITWQDSGGTAGNVNFGPAGYTSTAAIRFLYNSGSSKWYRMG